MAFFIIRPRHFDEDRERVVKAVVWTDPAGRRSRWRESVRVYTYDALAKMLNRSGLSVEETYGDFDGSPLDDDSPRMILLASKPE